MDATIRPVLLCCAKRANDMPGHRDLAFQQRISLTTFRCRKLFLPLGGVRVLARGRTSCALA